MFDKIAAYLERRMDANAINPDPFARQQVAVAALLVEASRLDGHYDAAEQGTVVRLLRQMSVEAQSEEHTSELQSRFDLVCRLLLEKKKKNNLSANHCQTTDILACK